MTSPLPGRARNELAHYTRLTSRFQKRKRVMELVHGVRQGNIRQLFPSELDFSITFEGSPIANFVDTVARDMAEVLAPLPALACVSGKMQTDADQKRAERKNRIGDHYWYMSHLEKQMLRGADRYVTYSFLPYFIEPDVRGKRPFIHAENPRDAVYELDRFGQCRVYGYEWRRSIDDLCAQFPECAAIIRTNPETGKDEPNGDTELRLVRWVDGTNVTLMLPERSGVILAQYAHKMSRPPVVIAERPGEDDTPRGQFDDVVWVQVARAIMSTLALEAASIAVQSPVAVPTDMDEFAIGPHAILQSDDAQAIHKVNLDLPPQIFAEGQVLDEELKRGARYPDARTGGVQASVITGKGVEALMGTFDAQIKGAQLVFKDALQEVTSLCFEMDEAWWPNETKTVRGTISGASYEFDYVPAKDINGRWDCTVTYGFAMGMQPSQSIVTLLQLEGAGLIAKGTTQENLPFSIDHVQEQRKIDIEGWRDALKQGMFAYVQSSAQIAAQGGDPSPLFGMAVDVIHQLQQGSSVEDAVQSAYATMQQNQQQEEAGEQPGAPDETDQMGGGPDQGPPVSGGPQGGSPTLEQMVAGFRGAGNLPVQQAQIRRSVPTGIQ